MTEEQAHSIEVLNQLYSLERRGLLPLLTELNVFADWGQARHVERIQEMAADHVQHAQRLAEAIHACDGAVRPVPPDASRGHLHYLDLRTLLPLVVADVAGLAESYDSVLEGRSSLTPEAARVIQQIALRHHDHLAELKQTRD